MQLEDDDFSSLMVEADDDGSAANDALIARRVQRLRHSARIVFDLVCERADERLKERLADKGGVLILVEAPSEAWQESVMAGVQGAVWSISRNSSRRISLQSGEPVSKRRWKTDDPSETILQTLVDQDIVWFAVTGKTPPPGGFAAFADLNVTIPALDAETMIQALSTRFPGWSGAWPGGFDPNLVQVPHIDLALARSKTADDAIWTLTKLISLVPSPPPEQSAPVFTDLRGYGDAHGWGLRLVTDVDAYRRGLLAWSDVDGGAVLWGPPGTGKTLFAASLAQALGIHFIATSYAAWQSAGTGHLGDVTKAIRAVFKQASDNAPALIFIDEIDSMPSRGTAHHDEWWRAVINALLEALDGIGRRDGVIVLAACNDPGGLDPALVRAGRLDRTFRVDLPDEEALVEIFHGHLSGTVAREDLAVIATALAGFTSGAEAVRIARDARRLARQAKRAVAITDLADVALPEDLRPDAVRWRVAVHEAGHALSSIISGTVPSCLSIVAGAGGGGHVTYGLAVSEGRRLDVEAAAIPILAGRAAEEAVLGSPSAGAGGSDQSDLAIVTGMIGGLDAHHGLGTRLSASGHSDAGFVESRLRRLYADAVLQMTTHRKALTSLAQLALERRVLGRQALEDFAIRHGFLAATEASPAEEKIDVL